MEGVNVGMPHVMSVTMQKRVGYMEVQLSNLLIEVNQIKLRMIDLINTQNGMLDHQAENEGKSMVTMAAFEKMVDAAVESGSKYGVSRKYITRFLCAEHNQKDGRYLQKKLGFTLKKKLTANEYLLTKSLYTINKK